jgi:hypothetical protein
MTNPCHQKVIKENAMIHDEDEFEEHIGASGVDGDEPVLGYNDH